MSDKLCMECTNYRTAAVHNFRWRADYHPFVKPHKHKFKLIKVTGRMFPVYYFQCSVKPCGKIEEVTKARFFRKTLAFHEAMRKIKTSVDKIQVRPPRTNPSSHFTVRTDGTIEDHTPWLQREGSNLDIKGVEFDGVTWVEPNTHLQGMEVISQQEIDALRQTLFRLGYDFDTLWKNHWRKHRHANVSIDGHYNQFWKIVREIAERE